MLNLQRDSRRFLKALSDTKRKFSSSLGISYVPPTCNIVFHEDRAIYFYVPKVACSSLKTVSAELLNISFSGSPHKIKFPSIARHEIEKYNHYFKFAFVRNPWDRIASCYNNKILTSDSINKHWMLESMVDGVYKGFLKYGVFHEGMPFDDFVDCILEIPDEQADLHFISQSVLLTDQSGQLLTDFVGKFEDLQADFSKIALKLGKPDLSIPHKAKSSNRSWQDYYFGNHSLIDKVGERYSRDIELFNYHF